MKSTNINYIYSSEMDFNSLHPLSHAKVERNYNVMLQHLDNLLLCGEEVFDKHPTLLATERKRFNKKIGYAQLFVLGQQKKLADSIQAPTSDASNDTPTSTDAEDDYDDSDFLYESDSTSDSVDKTMQEVPQPYKKETSISDGVSDQQVPDQMEDENASK